MLKGRLRQTRLDENTDTTDGHYILTLDQLALPPHLRIFPDANMNSTFYRTKARYFLTFQQAFTKWLQIQGLPPSLTQHLDAFLQHQWRLHVAQLKQTPRFTARLLRQLQAFLGDQVVLHHADHELQQLRVFCPRQYFIGAINTWQAPELFEPLPHLNPTNTHDHLTATIPPGLRSLQMGISQRLHDLLWHSSPQGQKTMEEGSHHHHLLSLPGRQPPSHHQQRT